MKCRTGLVVAAVLALCAGGAVAESNGDDGWEWHDGSTLPQEGRGALRDAYSLHFSPR